MVIGDYFKNISDGGWRMAENGFQEFRVWRVSGLGIEI